MSQVHLRPFLAARKSQFCHAAAKKMLRLRKSPHMQILITKLFLWDFSGLIYLRNKMGSQYLQTIPNCNLSLPITI